MNQAGGGDDDGVPCCDAIPEIQQFAESPVDDEVFRPADRDDTNCVSAGSFARSETALAVSPDLGYAGISGRKQPSQLMIRFVFRFLGLVTLAAAFVFFVYDGVRFLANRTLEFTSVGFVWATLDRNSLGLVQPAIERHGTPWLWQSVVQPYFLQQPVCLYLFILGIIFLVLGRRKKPLIGYSR